MESIPEDPYFQFRPDTLQEVRKEFNLHQPGVMAEVIKNFEEWIQKQNHFTKKDFSKHYLETSIILSKGSLERAKKSLDKLCTMKTLLPLFFSKHDARNEIVDLRSLIVPIVLPKLTEDNYRIFMFKPSSADIDTTKWFHYYSFFMLLCEYIKAHDYTQGLCCIVDVRNMNVLNFAMKLNVLDLRHVFSVLVEGYCMRLKGIHVVSESKAVDALVSVMKQIVSAKIGQRIQAHKTIDSVYQHIDKELLPEDYGGKEKSFIDIYEDIIDLLSRKDNVEYFKDICRPGTDEAYRHTAAYNNDILGMPGSFRKLTVD